MSAFENKYSGVGVALVTPFKKNKEIDFPALERVINHTISGGVDYLVSLGTTGETTTLSNEEQKEIITYSKNIIAERVPLVVGFGGNDTSSLVKNIKNQDFTGISAILSASPSYNKPTQEGILQHYRHVAEACPVPIILYNVPSRTASNMEATTVLSLAEESEQFIAVKEASGDFTQCMDIVQYRPDHFLCLSGDDLITLPLLSCGFDGVISVIANALPKEFSAMVHHATAQDFNSAKQSHYQIKEITQLIFEEGNPAGVKALLEILGLCEKHVRLPLVPASRGLYKKLEQKLRELSGTSAITEL